MRKMAVGLVLLFSVSLCQIGAHADTQRVTLEIWVDRGCGGEYFVGDMLRVTWRCSHTCEINFWEIEPDGKRRSLNTVPLISAAGEGSRGWTLKDYGYGKRAIYAEATSTLGYGSASAQCEYYVLKKAADIEVKVRDQDGEPIAGVTVTVDGVSAVTDTRGVCTMKEVAFGDHTITVTYGDQQQTSRITIASTQTQYVDFVFTVEKRGSIQVRVFDQKGDPVEDCDVYVDGAKEGRTSQEGELTVSVSEGTHFVEVVWQNVRAQQSVAVVRNQVSFADMTLTIEVETTLAVTVINSEGPIVDASVYLDNIFVGKTDAQGILKTPTTPGAHVVRVEKQEYESGIQSLNLEEGENSTTVVMTQKEASFYSLLSVLGILYLLKRRRH